MTALLVRPEPPKSRSEDARNELLDVGATTTTSGTNVPKAWRQAIVDDHESNDGFLELTLVREKMGKQHLEHHHLCASLLAENAPAGVKRVVACHEELLSVDFAHSGAKFQVCA